MFALSILYLGRFLNQEVDNMNMTGAQLFVNALKEENVDKIFAYPGGYITDILDELYRDKDIETILPRHEQALAHEADAYARSTGKPGVCLVTSGPGATNLVTGIATANYDSVPLVCFTGQVPTGLIGNDAFQEVDIVGITRSITKHALVVMDRKDLGRIIKEAFYIATSGKPGPVLVDLPADIMKETADDEYPKAVSIRSYKPNTEGHIGQLKRAMTLIRRAKKPLLLAGGGINVARANKEFRIFAEKCSVPVITTLMGQGAIPTNHELYVGSLGMHGCYAANKAVSECDVLFSIGARFNDRITGKISEFAPNSKIIHIDIDTASISRNIKVDIPIVADAKKALDKLLEYDFEKLDNYNDWIDEIKQWKKENPLSIPLKREQKEKKGICEQKDCPLESSLAPDEIIQAVNEQFKESIVVTDVGQHQMWTSQYLELDEKRQMLTSGGLGTMGYGFPGSIGAQIGNPDKQVICVTGDGGFQMNIQEMATAVSLELPIIVLIMNNSYLGMVRQMQELFYDKHYECTCLRYRKSCERNCSDPERPCPPYLPDFVKLAESYDAKGVRVWNKEELKKALRDAAPETKRPVVIECMIDRDLLVFPMVKSGNALNDMIMDN